MAGGHKLDASSRGLPYDVHNKCDVAASPKRLSDVRKNKGGWTGMRNPSVMSTKR